MVVSKRTPDRNGQAIVLTSTHRDTAVRPPAAVRPARPRTGGPTPQPRPNTLEDITSTPGGHFPSREELIASVEQPPRHAGRPGMGPIQSPDTSYTMRKCFICVETLAVTGPYCITIVTGYRRAVGGRMLIYHFAYCQPSGFNDRPTRRRDIITSASVLPNCIGHETNMKKCTIESTFSSENNVC